MVRRSVKEMIINDMFRGKAILIYGARQVGKTTLVNDIVRDFDKPVVFLNGDNADIRELFSNFNASKFLPYAGENNIVVIDEAQRIPGIGLAVKIIADNYKNVQLIVTGSSAFELANLIKEPMTGRKFEYFLWPFSFTEMRDYHGYLQEKRMVERRMIFGYYPEVALNTGKEPRLLEMLASDYLYMEDGYSP